MTELVEERRKECQIQMDTQFDGVKNGYFHIENNKIKKPQNANKITKNNAHHRLKFHIGRFHVVRA